MNPEKLRNSSGENEKSPQLEARQETERLRESLEQAAKKNGEDKEHKIEQARRDIERHSDQPMQPEIDMKTGESQQLNYKTRNIQEEEYRKTLNEIQQQFPRPQQLFSKVIHTKYIERVSEVAEKTIMRPNIALGATVGGFLGLLLFYVIAKRYGYELSGFEYFAFVIIGAILATLFEVVRNFIKKLRLRD